MVHFVGAGSGAADLITVRGARLLSEADVIIYAGSLVNPALLDYAREDAEKHDSARLTLEEVLDIIERAEKAGKTTVRLHTGDTSLFGAVKEQFDALDKLGVEYDVCPGVSSLSGAAASLKTEYTLPGVSQSVIISRMEGRTPVPEKEKIRDLAAHQATMVLFLSAGLLEGLQRELTAGGYPPETPAAIVYKATWPDEKVLFCRVDQLAETAKAHGVGKTALVLVGRFLSGGYERSKLYDPSFTTGFREAKP